MKVKLNILTSFLWSIIDIDTGRPPSVCVAIFVIEISASMYCICLDKNTDENYFSPKYRLEPKILKHETYLGSIFTNISRQQRKVSCDIITSFAWSIRS